jgi:hypothetical protein
MAKAKPEFFVKQRGGNILYTFQKRKSPIAKIDNERRLVFGWANIAVTAKGEQLVDHHDEMIDPEDLETAAYEFNLSFRETGEDHEVDSKGRLVESFFVTPEKLERMGLAKNALPQGWWVGFRVDDDAAWDRVKKGHHRMFSIQGVARRERVR